MKTILCSLLLLTIVFSCSKKEAELVRTEAVQETTARNTPKPDVVYHYQGKAYPLYYEEGSTTEVIQDENALALEALSGTSNFVTFLLPDKPAGHYYLFDSEFDGYDYMEKNDEDPLIGRRFKVSLRIDELRTRLLKKYGTDIDYSNSSIYADALEGVEAIYEELQINKDLPRDLEQFIGIKGGQLSHQRNPVLTVYEHDNYSGSELVVETAPNTVTWNYGDWNCFTMAANPDLSLEFQTNGNNWNDCISSKCSNYIIGADAMAVGYYKDKDYAVYSCGFAVQIIKKNNINASPGLCFSMLNSLWVRGHFCGHMNDQISSLRIKAIWDGCYSDDRVFNDLYNQ